MTGILCYVIHHGLNYQPIIPWFGLVMQYGAGDSDGMTRLPCRQTVLFRQKLSQINLPRWG